MERAPPNGFPRAIAAAAGQLSQIPESPNSTVSSDITMSQFQAKIEQLKTEVKLKHENGGNAPPTPPAAAQPSGVNGNDYAASGRFN